MFGFAWWFQRAYEIQNVHARDAYTHARIFAFRHVTIITAEISVLFLYIIMLYT
jgi:hypothetical protein